MWHVNCHTLKATFDIERIRIVSLRHLSIILPIEYISLNENNYYKIIVLKKIKMHGKNLQVPKLLIGLILIYIMGYSRAKYNFVGSANGITTMKFTVGKGILCIFRKIKKPN